VHTNEAAGSNTHNDNHNDLMMATKGQALMPPLLPKKVIPNHNQPNIDVSDDCEEEEGLKGGLHSDHILTTLLLLRGEVATNSCGFELTTTRRMMLMMAATTIIQ
jgi:hypothetical protein